MNNEQRQEYVLHFSHWFKDNQLAVRACLDLLDVLHLWDDLVDCDKAPTNVNITMRKALIDLPSNTFWHEYQPMLQPVIQSAYLQWSAANVLEKSDNDNDTNKAYMLRASVYQVFHMVAAICGGLAWAEQIAPQIYRLYGETLKNYKENGDA